MLKIELNAFYCDYNKKQLYNFKIIKLCKHFWLLLFISIFIVD